LHKAAEGGHVEVLKKLWDLAKELQLKPEKVRNLVLLSEDSWEGTAFKKAVEFGYVQVLKELWDLAKELEP